MNRKTRLFVSSMVFALFLGYAFNANTYNDFNSQAPSKNHILKADPKTENKTYLGTFKVTGYDLSYQSCEKTPEHPAYGITSSGKSLKNHSRESAMAVAVDPKYISLGSKLLLIFHGDKKDYTGIYTAVDTGSAIKGNRIDLFFGDEGRNVSREAVSFGVSAAEVYILNH